MSCFVGHPVPNSACTQVYPYSVVYNSVVVVFWQDYNIILQVKQRTEDEVKRREEEDEKEEEEQERYSEMTSYK